MLKKYLIRLSAAERTHLKDIIKKGRVAARKRRHAEILLKADQGEHGPAWNDSKIAETFELGRCLEAALNERQKSHHRSKKIDGENEARLTQLACSKPPER